jgi:predicted nucleotidyltransferase
MPKKLDFITPTLMKVLDIFMEDPLRERHEREVMREANVSKGSANNLLRLLAEQDILTRQRKGRMVFYRLKTEEPTVRQLKALANVYALKELVDQLKLHARKIVLFGSCAKGTDVKESDIDLLIIALKKEPAKRTVSTFNQKNNKKVAAITLDTNEYIQLKKEDIPLHENIERGIVLWEIT